MGLTVVTAPAIEPITLQQAKDHLRVDGTDEDAWIDRAIRGVRVAAEDFTGRAFITRTLDWNLDYFDQAALCRVPAPPLISVASIKYIDTAGVEQTLDPSLYKVDAVSQPGRIVPAYGKSWPGTRREINAAAIRLDAGYGAGLNSVPEDIIDAMLLMLGTRFKYREDAVTGGQVTLIPEAAMNLLLRKRDWRV